MRLTATTFVTIDAVRERRGAPQEDPGNGLAGGGGLPPYFDDETGQYMNEVFDQADAFLLGRFTYEAMAGYWPNVTDPAIRVGVALNNLPKHVVTTSLTDLTWNNSVPLTGDVAKRVTELKQQVGRELQIHGSGSLAGHLMGHGLIDAYRLVTFPVILGRGQRLFADGVPPAALRLTDTRTTS